MRFISLFAGVGGFDLALERLGHECVYANEWDKYCNLIYEKNFKRKQDSTDIRLVQSDAIPDHDLICGGFPCQSFSIAGKRKGFMDSRGTLFHEIARIARDKRPTYLLLENVRGLLSHDSGKTFEVILRTFDELGYDLQWQVLNSKNFGVPQNRERVFIIGHLRGTRRPEVFPITKFSMVSKNPAVTLTRRGYGSQRNGTYVTSDTKVGTWRTHKDGNGFREMKSNMVPTIPARAREDGSGQPVIKYRDLTDIDNIAPTIRSGGDGGVPSQRITDGYKIRRLTPTECERLQGFPDGWTEGVSDTQRYKMMGNAVTVNVVYEIAKLLPINTQK